MDKIAANNHVVLLRKEVKKAKAMVAGNLLRKVEKLKKEKDKASGDEERQKKIEVRVNRILAETKAIKSLDTYPICKQVTLNPDVKYWTDLVGNPKSSAEERLCARIICKNNIQKRVAKFIADNQDCQEWLEEYFEFREKKQDLKASTTRS